MRIARLPESVKQLPATERIAALQAIVNEALHRRNICPRGQYVAGPSASRVAVVKKNRAYFAESNFSNYNRQTGESVPETYLEKIAVEAVASAR